MQEENFCQPLQLLTMMRDLEKGQNHFEKKEKMLVSQWNYIIVKDGYIFSREIPPQYRTSRW